MIAKVIVDITHANVDKIFDYLIPQELDVSLGSRVLVPFGKQKIEGFVVKIENTSSYDIAKLKSVISILDDIPPLTHDTLALTKFVSKTYHALYSEVLRLMIPSEMRKGRVSEKFISKIKLVEDNFEKAMSLLKANAKSQRSALEDIFDGESDYTILAEKHSYASLIALEKKGIIEIFKEKQKRTPYEFMEVQKEKLKLTQDQERAIKTVKQTNKLVTAIKGVTGSGKTEIYLRLFESALKEGKSSILLVPEIALTPQMVGKLRAYFGDNVAIIHSGLGAGERFDEWWRIREGEAKIVVGARSAVFAPVQNIGYIVIDEEHESSYISESSPRYDTSEVAKFRVKQNQGKLILGSATPSIETFFKAQEGEYELVEINERVNKFIMPIFDIIDLKQEVRRGNKGSISNHLISEIENVLNKKEQAILFLNRRGFASFYQCEECGYVCSCNNCDVSLTLHKSEKALKCHYCGQKYTIPEICPECRGTHFKQGGTGTEAVVSELKKHFPTARILRMDNDTTKTKDAHTNILQTFRNYEADILVGTQMVAKGHDFPLVTLVGIINADMSLYFSDFRSGERTFQLITQVAGRAGRGEKRGKVVLQTYSPQHHILKFATKYDYAGFFDYECNIRQNTSFPPFAVVLRVMIVSKFEDKARQVARGIYNYMTQLRMENEQNFAYFNGMKSTVYRIENKFRYQIIARVVGEKSQDIVDRIYEIIEKNKTKDVTSYLEVNPNNMF